MTSERCRSNDARAARLLTVCWRHAGLLLVLLFAPVLMWHRTGGSDAPGVGAPEVRKAFARVPNQAEDPGLEGYVLTDTWPLIPDRGAPVDVALDDRGNVYMADGRTLKVEVFDPQGRHRASWSPPGDSLDDVYATSVAVHDDWIAILWSTAAHVQGQRGTWLDTRRSDGSEYEPPRFLGVLEFGSQPVTRIAIDPVTGHVLFPDRDRTAVLSIDPASGEIRPVIASVEQDVVRDIAATTDTIGVVLDFGIAQFYPRGDGEPSGDVYEAIAIASTDEGRFALLQRGDRAEPRIVLVDPDSGTIDPVALAAGELTFAGGSRWPWAIDAGASGIALSASMGGRYRVTRLDDRHRAATAIDGTHVRNGFHPESGWSNQGSMDLAVHPGGDLYATVLDGRRLVAVDGDGALGPTYALSSSIGSIAIDDRGALFAAVGPWVIRYDASVAITPTWTTACCSGRTRLVAGSDVVYATDPLVGRVVALDAATGAVIRVVELSESVGLWPSDLALTIGSRLLTGDLIRSQIQVWRQPDAPEVTWQAGLLAGPRRLATGRTVGGDPVVLGLMADGYIELHDPSDGNLLARWLPSLDGPDGFAMSDVEVLPDGRIAVADPRAAAVRVFGPGAGPTPTPPQTALPTPTPSDRSCDVSGDKVAGPRRIVLGQTASVTLTMRAECPDTSRVIGADLLLVMDRSGSMLGDKLAAAKEAASNFVELLDVRHHRVGLLSFNSGTTRLVNLTDRSGLVIRALEVLDSSGGTDIAAALNEATRMLDEQLRDETLPVIVLLTDGQSEAAPAIASGERARNLGIQIYTIGLGDQADRALLQNIAGAPGRSYYAPAPSDLYPIYREILREVLSSLAGNLIIDDLMGRDVRYVPGSAEPGALESSVRLRWGRSLLPSSGITLTYDIVPQIPGIVPTNLRAWAEYTDGDGVRREYEFPVPEIEVITPTPTPTPTPTLTPTPSVIQLPIAYRNACNELPARTDIVLLIDTSSSMTGAKLDQARAAARTFVNLLELPGDRAAVFGFNSEVQQAANLTGDREALRGAIEALAVRPGTDIAGALRAAYREIAVGSAGREDRQAVVILLSDGAHNGPDGEVVEAASLVRRLGARLYAIGLGAGADEALLQRVADRRRYLFAPHVGELEGIYRELASVVRCR